MGTKELSSFPHKKCIEKGGRIFDKEKAKERYIKNIDDAND